MKEHSTTLFSLIMLAISGAILLMLYVTSTNGSSTTFSKRPKPVLPAKPVSNGNSNTKISIYWASFTLLLAIVGMEVGYLLVYRCDWSIGLGLATINALTIIAISFFETLLLKKNVSTTHFLGIFLCALGIIFTNIGK